MKPIAALFSVTLLLVALAACGQKGPLYLPEEDSPAERQEQQEQQQPQLDQGAVQ